MPFYYNMSFLNNTNNSTTLKFNADVITSLLPPSEKPSDYNLCVMSYNLPTYSLPFMIFRDNFYRMAIRYNGTIDYKYVEYIPQSIATSLPESRYIYEIQAFIQMLNKTILNLIKSITITVTLPDEHNAPYFMYNEETELISFHATDFYLNSPVTNPPATFPIEILLNNNLLKMIHGLPVYFENVDTLVPYKLLVMDNHNYITLVEPVPPLLGLYEYTMIQQCSSFRTMTNFLAVILTSNLCTKSEMLSVRFTDNTFPIINLGQTNTSSDSSTMQIIHTNIPENISIKNFNNGIVYNNTYPNYHEVELQGTTPIHNVQINVYYQLNNGSFLPAIIAPWEKAKLVLMFTKK